MIERTVRILGMRSLLCVTSHSFAVNPAADVEHAKLLAEYSEIRKRAQSGDAEDKLDAFLFIYKYMRRLQGELPEALQFLADSAVLGYRDAQYNYGHLLQTGHLLQQDANEATKWFLLAAQQGHETAMLWSGLKLVTEFYESTEKEKDAYFRSAEFWLQQARNLLPKESEQWLLASEAMGRLYLGPDCKREAGVKLLQELGSHGYEPAKETLSAFSEVIESDSASPECLIIRK